jgi:hydroxyacylglutathione hydrolase
VHGPARERIPAPFEPHAEGDELTLLGVRLTVMDVPGHTAGHIAYLCDDLDGSGPALFCGDTLFSAGCGRLFEGTAAQMHASLERLARLPGPTRVCCAHEYTLANLRFAQTVEPANADIAAHLARCESMRAVGHVTLPSTIEQERRINPFLRCSEAAVIAAACAQGTVDTSPLGVFAGLREWKNRFR